MKKNYSNLVDPGNLSFKLNRLIEVFQLSILIVIFNTIDLNYSYCQSVIPTKGKDFWIGFPYNPDFQLGPRRCDVFITSNTNTSGIISIPQQGWSQAFNVVANVTTTISLPIALVEHTTSEVIENRGVEITTLDTVNVFAISFQQYSADATLVYPKQSLGTEYRICSYKGLSSSSPPNINSDLQIVATEDGTQIRITPTAPTLGGKPANVPFIINLNHGQSYQLISSTGNNDLTGTVIKATDSSGECRPFAVFSGTGCADIPSGCTACDILYDQALPVANWGKIYFAVPFSFATSYTLRILADQNNTSYTVNGGPTVILNAGQYSEINNITGTRCIIGNKPISVVQYMQGISCSGSGDPSMMYLNSQDQKIDNVTFSTITSTIINQHDVNVIMNTAFISQLRLDGVPVPSTAFNPMSYCTSVSYAQLPLTQGSHTLTSDSGFTAYIYGTGSAESYAYSVGSFTKNAPIHVDSVLCTSDTVHIGNTSSLFNAWWSTTTNPTDTIGVGPILTLTPPILANTYIQHGNQFISGCEKNYYFNIEVPTPPTSLITANNNIVCQNQHVQLNVITTPLSPQYTYLWTPSTGLNNPTISNPVLTATISGWYKVAIMSANGCANSVYDSIFINVLPMPLPNINLGNNQAICLGNSVTLNATGGASYLWYPGGNINNSITVSPIITTNYIVYVNDSNGCQNSDTVTVNVLTLPLANAGINQSICTGTTTTLTATGGISYLWNTSSSAANPISVTPPLTTDYNVIVTGVNGCTKRDTITVTVNPIPTISLGNDHDICAGDTITLIANGGLNYIWTPGGYTTNSITISPAINTNYIVKGTDSNGCHNNDTLVVKVHSKPIVNAGFDQTICLGDSATFTVTGTLFYSWAPGGFMTNSILVSPLANTSYIVTVSDTLGCHQTDTVRLTVNPLPMANAGADQSMCTSGTVTLNASPPGAIYLWNPLGNTNGTISISPSITTNYFLEVTDMNGCKDYDTVQVIVFQNPIANAGLDQTICSGAHATLSASGGVTYLWTPGGIANSTINVSPSLTTNYSVQVTDSNGCQMNDSILVNVIPNNSGNNTLQNICLGETTTLIDSGGVSYNWFPGGSTSNSIIVSPSVNSIYYVNIITPIGCLVFDTISVVVHSLPMADAGIDRTICLGLNTNLIATGGVSYLWITNGVATASNLVAPNSTTSYIVQVTDFNNCKNTDTVVVNVNSLPFANAGSDSFICLGDSTLLKATGGLSYSWLPNVNSGATIWVAPITTSKYIVQVVDSNGCINSDTTSVNVNFPPVADYSLALPICENSALAFINNSQPVSGNITNNKWEFGDGGTSVYVNPIHVFSSARNYAVELVVTDRNGCKDSVEHFIDVNANPIIDFSTENTCVDQNVLFRDLSNSNPSIIQWQWNFGDGNYDINQNPNHSYSQAGLYNISLFATTDSGCSLSLVKPHDVEIYPLPEAEFTTTPDVVSIMNALIQVNDESSGGNHWQWNFGDGLGFSELRNPQYNFKDTGNFIVQLILTSIYGCIDTAYHDVYVAPNFTVYFPNAFTPNGDGKNDFFGPFGLGIGEYEFYIFDRWGKNIFHSNSISNNWDGKVQGSDQNCNEGTYVYLVKLVDYKKSRHEYTGMINLIR